MSSILCSDNFRSFFENIEKIGIPAQELPDVVGKELSLIAPDIRLGRMTLEFISPPMPYNVQGTHATCELYLSPVGFDENNIKTEFATGDNGTVIITSDPEKGSTWSEEEKAEITFLHKSVFVIFGRARLSDIVKIAVTSDAMTKLPNASGFMSIGTRLLKQGQLSNYTAMYINLKNFRCVNSQMGNRHGDEAIRAYAATLHAWLGEDGYAARLGGDNFTVLVKKERKQELLRFLSDVLVEVEVESGKIPFTLSARVGVYDIQPGDIMPNIMECISTAVSNAKRNPATNVVTFTAETMKKVEREHAITAMFPAALNNREFIVYYQPKVDLSTSRMCGCEALVRWKKDDRIISPAEFIPVFERDGNVCALDFYMLDNVCRDISEWLKNGLEPVTVSVNFSKTHLHNPNIAEDILAVINKYNIDTKYIEVELTEMSDFNDYEAFKALVNKMKENGVVTSIDDFGTGYSSLNLLTDFMFDVVKLDKSFLDNIERSGSKTDEIVVRNIVKMIKELGMKAIAEGVETVQQAQFLKDIECTMVQGYLYDRPLCVEDFTKRLGKKEYEKLL